MTSHTGPTHLSSACGRDRHAPEHGSSAGIKRQFSRIENSDDLGRCAKARRIHLGSAIAGDSELQAKCPFPYCNSLGSTRFQHSRFHDSLDECPQYKYFLHIQSKTIDEEAKSRASDLTCGGNSRKPKLRRLWDLRADNEKVSRSENLLKRESPNNYKWLRLLSNCCRILATGQGNKLQSQLQCAIRAIPSSKNFSKLHQELQNIDETWHSRTASQNKILILRLIRKVGNVNSHPDLRLEMSFEQAEQIIDRLKMLSQSPEEVRSLAFQLYNIFFFILNELVWIDKGFYLFGASAFSFSSLNQYDKRPKSSSELSTGSNSTESSSSSSQNSFKWKDKLSHLLRSLKLLLNHVNKNVQQVDSGDGTMFSGQKNKSRGYDKALRMRLAWLVRLCGQYTSGQLQKMFFQESSLLEIWKENISTSVFGKHSSSSELDKSRTLKRHIVDSEDSDIECKEVETTEDHNELLRKGFHPPSHTFPLLSKGQQALRHLKNGLAIHMKISRGKLVSLSESNGNDVKYAIQNAIQNTEASSTHEDEEALMALHSMQAPEVSSSLGAPTTNKFEAVIRSDHESMGRATTNLSSNDCEKWFAAIQSRISNPRLWHPAASFAFYTSIVDPLGSDFLSPVTIGGYKTRELTTVRQSKIEAELDRTIRSPVNDPTLTSPVYFETASTLRERADRRLIQIRKTKARNRKVLNNDVSFAEQAVKSHSSLMINVHGTKIKCLLNKLIEVSATLIPHRYTEENVCAKLDSSKVRIYLPRILFNRRDVEYGWWILGSVPHPSIQDCSDSMENCGVRMLYQLTMTSITSPSHAYHLVFPETPHHYQNAAPKFQFLSKVQLQEKVQSHPLPPQRQQSKRKVTQTAELKKSPDPLHRHSGLEYLSAVAETANEELVQNYIDDLISKYVLQTYASTTSRAMLTHHLNDYSINDFGVSARGGIMNASLSSPDEQVVSNLMDKIEKKARVRKASETDPFARIGLSQVLGSRQSFQSPKPSSFNKMKNVMPTWSSVPRPQVSNLDVRKLTREMKQIDSQIAYEGKPWRIPAYFRNDFLAQREESSVYGTRMKSKRAMTRVSFRQMPLETHNLVQGDTIARHYIRQKANSIHQQKLKIVKKGWVSVPLAHHVYIPNSKMMIHHDQLCTSSSEEDDNSQANNRQQEQHNDESSKQNSDFMSEEEDFEKRGVHYGSIVDNLLITSNSDKSCCHHSAYGSVLNDKNVFDTSSGLLYGSDSSVDCILDDSDSIGGDIGMHEGEGDEDHPERHEYDDIESTIKALAHGSEKVVSKQNFQWNKQSEYNMEAFQRQQKPFATHCQRTNYLVEKILAHKELRTRGKPPRSMFLVKWYGLGHDFNTWESAESFSSDIPLQAYLKHINQRKKCSSNRNDQKKKQKYNKKRKYANADTDNRNKRKLKRKC